jgi:pimeloyl-ACP methyl ester carboxylesterase
MLNGMWGDYLQARGNGLAVEMAFYRQGRVLKLRRDELQAAFAPPAAPLTRKVCVLVHGLGCNELLWQFAPPSAPGEAEQPTSDYGRLLADDVGCTPFYVRYNTGEAVAHNGRTLGRLIDALWHAYPLPIEEIILIGHSMGGLVLRSACHYATQQNEPWVEAVRHVIYLGTPHDGADLARLAQTTEQVLLAIPNPITKIVGDFFGLRSQGIKDLCHGTLLAPDVLDEGYADVGDGTHHHQRPVPWLPHARHYLVGGTITGDPAHVAAVLLGDGLVGRTVSKVDAVPDEQIKLFPGVAHLQLARNWDVYRQIASWCAAEGAGR